MERSLSVAEEPLVLVCRGIDRSEYLNNLVRERFQDVEDRFPDLKHCRKRVTLSVENSPKNAGPDLFCVKFVCLSGRYRGVVLERSAENFYIALADVVGLTLERLNRFGDRRRVRSRKTGVASYPKTIKA